MKERGVEEDAEEVPSPPETPTQSDRDFIVPDSRYVEDQDETYVDTDDECEFDEEGSLTYYWSLVH